MERERESGGGGGGNECTVGLTVVNLMTFSSYQRKIRTLPFLPLFTTELSHQNAHKVSGITIYLYLCFMHMS